MIITSGLQITNNENIKTRYMMDNSIICDLVKSGNEIRESIIILQPSIENEYEFQFPKNPGKIKYSVNLSIKRLTANGAGTFISFGIIGIYIKEA